MTKVYIKLIAMSLALILSVSVVIMSSYAWLVLSGNPAATGIHVAIGGGNTILTAPNIQYTGTDNIIYNIPGRFSDRMNFGQEDSYAYLKNLGNLTPVSTTNGIDWFLPTYYTGNDELVQQGKVPSGALKDVSEFHWDNSLSHANLTANKKQEIDEGNYVYLDFWVVSPGGDYTLRVSTGEGRDDSGSFVIDLPEVDSAEDADGLTQPTGSAAAAVRIGFLASDVLLTDSTMSQYENSRYFDDRFTALKGIYVEPNTGAIYSDSDYFTIYEPNADYHPGHKGLDGSYVETKTLTRKNDVIQEQDMGRNVTVQKKSTWAMADNGMETRLEQQYKTAMMAHLGAVLSDQDKTDLFYERSLQGQLYPLVDKGSFLRSTGSLVSQVRNNGGVVSAETMHQALPGVTASVTAGATDDVEIIKLERNVPQRIRMFIWLEGQDIDCMDSISSSRFAINIELAGGDH